MNGRSGGRQVAQLASPAVTRRLALAVAALVAGPLLASCSQVDQPAATVNGDEISMGDFEAVLAGFTEANALATQEPSASIEDVYPGSDARQVLGAQIRALLLTQELDRLGATLTDAELAATAASYESNDPAGWAAAPEPLRELVVELNAASDAITEATANVGETEIRAFYDQGPTEVGVVCPSHILVETEAAAEDALERLEAGESFADVADEVSIDGSGDSGGALVDPSTGSACYDVATFAQTFVAEFVDGALAASVGEPTAPVRSQFGYHLIYLRPFDEVADQVIAAFPAGRASALAASADVSVNTSIGQWSPSVAGVVSLDEQV